MSNPIIDLRSDTVTQPTDEMRQAISEALVGDDGFGDDPTVAALEASFAERLGKQAAMFVPSGVMANQIALRILTKPGDAVAVGRRQHVVSYELGAAGRNAHIQFQTLEDKQGYLDLTDLALALEGRNHHLPEIGAIFIENTHMASGGKTWPLETLGELPSVAQGRPIHLDGARIFNAEISTGVSAATLASGATTVMACLSKGLSAPIGSLLAGPADLMKAARIERKRLGGSMRQVGIVAAAGIVALHTMVERLGDDHRRASIIRDAVAKRFPETAHELEGQDTNIVAFQHSQAGSFLEALEHHNILAGTVAPGLVRLVTHRHIDDAMAERCAKVIATS